MSTTSELNEQQQFLKDIKSNLEKKQTELLTQHGELQLTKEYLTSQIKNMIELISQMVSVMNKTVDEKTVLKLQEEIIRLGKCCDNANNVKNDCCDELNMLKSEMTKNKDLIKSMKEIIKEINDFKVGTFDGTIQKLTSLKFCEDVNTIIEDLLINNVQFIEYMKINPNEKVNEIYNEMKKTVGDCKKKNDSKPEQIDDFDGNDDSDDEHEGLPDIHYDPEVVPQQNAEKLQPEADLSQMLVKKDEIKVEVPQQNAEKLQPEADLSQMLLKKDEIKAEVPQSNAEKLEPADILPQVFIEKKEEKHEGLKIEGMKTDETDNQTLLEVNKKIEEVPLVVMPQLPEIPQTQPQSLLPAAQTLGVAITEMVESAEGKCAKHKTNDNGECTLENDAECIWDSDVNKCRYKTDEEIASLSAEFAKLPKEDTKNDISSSTGTLECVEPYSVKCEKPGKKPRCVPKWVHENDKVLSGEVTESHFCDMEDSDIEKIVKERRSDGFYQPFDNLSKYSTELAEKQNGGYKRKRKNPFYFH